MVEDFERPPVPKIVGEILSGILPPKQMGTDFVDAFGRFYEQDEMAPINIEDMDFIVYRRKGGYLTPEFTDIIGLEVHTFARTRERSENLMAQVDKAILRAEGNDYAGFLIDFSMTLNGPEEDRIDTMDDRVMVQSYELHSRVNWT